VSFGLLLGRNVYEASAMEATSSFTSTASDDFAIVLGDFSEYQIVDRVGATLALNPMVVGSSRRPTGQAGYLLWWRTGADVLATGAFQLLRL
jgi:HK97 family phage major capsid protein